MRRRLRHIGCISLLFLLMLSQVGAQDNAGEATNADETPSATPSEMVSATSATPITEEPPCQLENILTPENTFAWTIYPTTDEAATDTLVDAAKAIIQNYDIPTTYIYTPLFTGTQWVLQFPIGSEANTASASSGYVVMQDNAAFVLQTQVQQDQALAFIRSLLISEIFDVPVLENADGEPLTSYQSNGITWELPASWRQTGTDGKGWLRYQPTDMPDTFIAFALLHYTQDCQRINLGKARRDITSAIEGYNDLWQQNRTIGDDRWSVQTYHSQSRNQRMEGRLYLHYQEGTVLAIMAQTPTGPSASTFFRQLTSHIALIMTR
ncbi:hypothetical protein G4Y79_16980 [Phototrophicus methaneseepsis]|uniref:Serine hydrolase n=1 Tax=Phototrophicus methaneseepsis TaxID=2710758 RepID=A0A7S8E6Q0_9CHLR|nr:hypothetical protein [Phototrophicus methaneseepsis]QPC81381.1 hypothetical protein G4Y79_16980 [Phototrophicus methaneseepsis]